MKSGIAITRRQKDIFNIYVDNFLLYDGQYLRNLASKTDRDWPLLCMNALHFDVTAWSELDHFLRTFVPEYGDDVIYKVVKQTLDLLPNYEIVHFASINGLEILPQGVRSFVIWDDSTRKQEWVGQQWFVYSKKRVSELGLTSKS